MIELSFQIDYIDLKEPFHVVATQNEAHIAPKGYPFISVLSLESCSLRLKLQILLTFCNYCNSS